MKRIDVVKSFLNDEEYLFDDICPYCFHLLKAHFSEEYGDYLYCPNPKCNYREQFPFVYNIHHFQ